MTKKDPLRNWQLEEGSEPLEQWKLQDAEQDLDKHLQLQSTDAPQTAWQPVEYQRPARPQRNWVLPSIVIVALLIALAYVGWISLSRIGGDVFSLASLPIPGFAALSTETPQAEPTSESGVGAVAAETATPTAAPTDTPLAPTPAPTLMPTPTPVLITRVVGTVNADAGVNAREEPTTDAAIVILLNKGDQLTVVTSETRDDVEWLQVILADNKVAWVAAEFVDRAVGEQLTLEQWNEVLARAGLPPMTPEPAAQAPDQPVGAERLDAVVTGEPGINARQEPAREAVVLLNIANGERLTAIGRNAAGDWLVVELPDGNLGWVLTSFVSLSGEVNTLPELPANVVLEGLPEPATPAAQATLAATSTPVAESAPTGLVVSSVTPREPYTNTIPATGAAIAVTDTTGVNARSAPALDGGILGVVPNGAVLPAVGLSEDGEWVRVELPAGQQGWMFRDAVSVSSNIDTLPVLNADGEPVVSTATPEPEGPTATVSTLLGSNVRPSPSEDSEPLDTAAMGEVLPAIGRTADGLWVQVSLDGDTSGWMLAATVELNVDIATLPVIEQ